MKKVLGTWLWIVGLLVGPLTAAGQETAATTETRDEAAETPSKPKRGSLVARFFRNFENYDTAYITPNYYNFTAMAQASGTFQSYRLSGFDADGTSQSISLAPRPTLKVGPYFGWRWIFFGYTFDVGRMGNRQMRREFNLSLYSAMLGCDLVYMKNDGDFRLKRVTGFDGIDNDAYDRLPFDGLRSQTAGINVYYIFNHRRFSYPAAFSQSTVQRRSCGSWKVGFQYTRQRIDFDPTRLPADLQDQLTEQLHVNEVRYNDYSINVGYAYNWVFARNWLLAASAAPAIGFKQTVGDGNFGQMFRFENLNFDLIARAGLVWNNSKWFAGLSMVAHVYNYRKDRFALTNSLSYVNIYAGLCFYRKKAYKP